MLKKKKHIINGLFIVFPITVLYNNFAFWNIAMEGKKMSAKKSKMKNLTEGSPAKLIIGFAIPMFLGMLFQQFYSMVDTMIVGKFLGLKPLAGVGSTGSLNFMVIGFCIGVCNGFAIPVAQKFGAKDESALRRFVANATWLCVGFAVVMTLAASVFCRDILLFLRTPEDVFQYAYWYMLIIFLGIPCTFLYNFLAALIRSLGDSRTPVVFLAISSVLNIGLDLLFILLFRWGVIGAALATVLSQGISGICCLWYVGKTFPILHGSRSEWKAQPKYMVRLCTIGIPMGQQYSITAIGTLVIQAAVNGFGATVMAGVTAAGRLGNFLSCPIEALGQTMAPSVGQNVGAGKLDRVGKGLKAASLMGFCVSAVLLAIVVLFGRRMSVLFLDANEVEAMGYAYQYMTVTAAGYCLLTLVNTVRFTIQGMGFSGIAILAGVFEMAARTLAGTLLVAVSGYFGICMANTLAWIFADAFLIPAFFLCRRKLAKR